jgi:magnesium and cobalt transporter
MAELPDGHAAAGPFAADDEDPDSTGRSSFFARLFRRDQPEDETDPARDGGVSGRDLRMNLGKLRSMRVDDVSVPRADIVAVPADAGLAEIVEVFKASELSRLPVYSETLDQPLGLVHLKDLALQYGFGSGDAAFDLPALTRPLLYAPPSMPIGVLLQKMQTARVHMALVIDEYGGVDGLVTIEDLLEQIVGDISDEHDEAEGPLWMREAPGVYVAQGRMDLDDFEDAAGVTLADPALADDVDTLGGLVFRLAGRVPVRGEIVRHPEGHEFEVTDADQRKIKRLRVRLNAGAGASAAAAE